MKVTALPCSSCVDLDLMVAGKEQRVSTYLAEPATIDAGLRPSPWYKGLVAAGVRYHRFPDSYLDRLVVVPQEEDPDPGRSVSTGT